MTLTDGALRGLAEREDERLFSRRRSFRGCAVGAPRVASFTASVNRSMSSALGTATTRDLNFLCAPARMAHLCAGFSVFIFWALGVQKKRKWTGAGACFIEDASWSEILSRSKKLVVVCGE